MVLVKLSTRDIISFFNYSVLMKNYENKDFLDKIQMILIKITIKSLNKCKNRRNLLPVVFNGWINLFR